MYACWFISDLLKRPPGYGRPTGGTLRGVNRGIDDRAPASSWANSTGSAPWAQAGPPGVPSGCSQIGTLSSSTTDLW